MIHGFCTDINGPSMDDAWSVPGRFMDHLQRFTDHPWMGGQDGMGPNRSRGTVTRKIGFWGDATTTL